MTEERRIIDTLSDDECRLWRERFGEWPPVGPMRIKQLQAARRDDKAMAWARTTDAAGGQRKEERAA